MLQIQKHQVNNIYNRKHPRVQNENHQHNNSNNNESSLFLLIIFLQFILYFNIQFFDFLYRAMYIIININIDN